MFNVAQYAYLLHMVAHVVNMEPDELITLGVDSHIYENQVAAVKELLLRDSHPDTDPRIKFHRQVDNIDDCTFEDVSVEGYQHQPRLDIPVAV